MDDKNIKILFDVKASDERFKTYWQLVNQEFQNKIPWLRDFDLNKEFSACLLTKDDKVIGGLMQFAESPEAPEIIKQKQEICGDGGCYISCLMLEKPYRGQGLGAYLLNNWLKQYFDEVSLIWGVVSDFKLLPYYHQFGMQDFEMSDPKIRLAIWSRDNFNRAV